MMKVFPPGALLRAGGCDRAARTLARRSGAKSPGAWSRSV